MDGYNIGSFNLSGLFSLLHRGGPIVAILGVMSVFGLAIALLKLWQFASARIYRRSFIEPALARWQAGEQEAGLAVLDREQNPIADTLGVAMRGVRSGAALEVVREETARVGARHLATLRSYFRTLEVISSLSPLLGLLGTVIGMITAFQQLASAGSQVNPAILSNGIWQALLTTAVGLVVAIPTVALLNWFERIVERVHEDMQDALTQFFTRHEAALSGNIGPADNHQPSVVEQTKPQQSAMHTY